MTDPTPTETPRFDAAYKSGVRDFSSMACELEVECARLERDKQRLDKLDALIGPHQNIFNSVALFEEDGGLILMTAGMDAIVGANIREVLDQLPAASDAAQDR